MVLSVAALAQTLHFCFSVLCSSPLPRTARLEAKTKSLHLPQSLSSELSSQSLSWSQTQRSGMQRRLSQRNSLSVHARGADRKHKTQYSCKKAVLSSVFRESNVNEEIFIFLTYYFELSHQTHRVSNNALWAHKFTAWFNSFPLKETKWSILITVMFSALFKFSRAKGDRLPHSLFLTHRGQAVSGGW